jgi:hypothetical protein
MSQVLGTRQTSKVGKFRAENLLSTCTRADNTAHRKTTP